MNKKVSMLQLYLTIIAIVNLLVSNIITSKQIILPFNITMTAGIFVFPITYILSDVFSEVYGYKWSRLVCYLSFIANIFMVSVFELVIKAPSPVYWQDQMAFQTVLGNTPKILFASMLGFMVGDFVNDKVFKLLKAKHKESHDGFGARAILSSLCGEMADSFIFIPIAFLGQMPIQTLIAMMFTQVCLKVGYEIVILPLTKYIVNKVSAYENEVGVIKWQTSKI